MIHPLCISPTVLVFFAHKLSLYKPVIKRFIVASIFYYHMSTSKANVLYTLYLKQLPTYALLENIISVHNNIRVDRKNN